MSARRPSSTVTKASFALPAPARPAPRGTEALPVGFEFDGAPQPPPRRAETAPVDASIKSSIIRWLNEEL